MDSSTRNRAYRACLNAACLVLAFVGTIAGEEPPTRSTEERAAHLARMKEVAASIHVYATERKQTEVELVQEPVLRYSDETRRLHESSLWIWREKGRPCAIGAIEFYTNGRLGPRWLYEIASLSSDRISIQRGSGLNWTAKEPGLDLQSVPGATTPAAAPARRLVQMKELLRRFAAHERAPVGGRIELRSLSSPLYRYEAADELIDGAIFAFANGTNPEVFLVLEARQQTSVPAVWKFGLAQMTGAEVTVELDGKNIWSRTEADPPATRESYINGWINAEKSQN